MTGESGPATPLQSDVQSTRHLVSRVLILLLLLIAAWVLWSGFFKPLLLALGALSCGLTIYLARRMGYFDNELFAFRYGFRLFRFWGWLAMEIIRSSIAVAIEVLRPTLRIKPRVITVTATEFGLVDQVLLGNSITLTPGTLTLDVHEGRLLVHALTEAAARDVEEGQIARRIRALGPEQR